MKYSEPTADVGVLIGRFQVADLHDGHRGLIEDVMARHKKVIILLGVAPIVNSTNNPLDFESRKQMLMHAYPSLTVLYVKDMNDDLRWSQQVDSVIRDVVSPTQSVLLYGSRDSFIRSYLGKFDTHELPTHHQQSGSSLRSEIARMSRDSADFRAGVIWASRNRYPTSYQAVDIAIFDPSYNKLILGHKPNEPGWRLPGGFADPCSPSLEGDAGREALEETGVHVHNLVYVRSFVIDDWRYRNEPDCIKTALFMGTTWDEPVADDDIDKVQWFGIDEVSPESMHLIMPDHRDLIRYALLKASSIRAKAAQ